MHICRSALTIYMHPFNHPIFGRTYWFSEYVQKTATTLRKTEITLCVGSLIIPTCCSWCLSFDVLMQITSSSSCSIHAPSISQTLMHFPQTKVWLRYNGWPFLVLWSGIPCQSCLCSKLQSLPTNGSYQFIKSLQHQCWLLGRAVSHTVFRLVMWFILDGCRWPRIY